MTDNNKNRITMNPAMKMAWLAALRSGAYRQTRGRLKRRTTTAYNGYSFCCLGVLQDITGVRGGGDMNLTEKRCGIKVSRVTGLSLKHISRLVTLNDLQRYTFDQIADWIEEYVET